ncbi:esterase OVCA2-like isoform X2 [Amblyomma americanum]
MNKTSISSKVLCLHGYGQDAGSFRSKIGDFWWATKSLLDLVFIDAPHIIEKDVHSEWEIVGGRGWWISGSAREFEESVKAIEQACKTEGPCDGILGFSQGACMTAMILSLQCLKQVECSFKFGVLVSGFQSRTCPQDHLFAKEGSIDVPTLHIIGDNDTIIPKERAIELLPFFVSPCVLYHPGGHSLPTSSQCKKEYIDFFKQMASTHSGT